MKCCFSRQLKYFDDPVVRCMQAMDCVESREMADKCEFFAVLPQAVPQFPKVCISRIRRGSITVCPIAITSKLLPVMQVTTRRSQHSQECKDPRRQCFCYSWPWPFLLTPPSPHLRTHLHTYQFPSLRWLAHWTVTRSQRWNPEVGWTSVCPQ